MPAQFPGPGARALRALAVALAAAVAAARCAAATDTHLEPPKPAVFATTGDASAAPDIVDPIEPDRPDVTNGSHIVDVGLMQVEVGAQHVRQGTQNSFGTPTTVRVGLTEWLEARVGSDGYLHQSDSGAVANGAGNVQVGAKVRLFADPGGIPVLSILPTVNLPVASAEKGLGSGSADYSVAVLTGTDLGKTSHVDINYGIAAIGTGSGLPHFTQHLVSVSFSHSLTEQLSPYVEVFWFSKQDALGGRVLSMDAGAIQAFTARLAVDGGFAVGLSHSAPDLSLFGGVSIIVGEVLGDHGVIARQRRAARMQEHAH